MRIIKSLNGSLGVRIIKAAPASTPWFPDSCILPIRSSTVLRFCNEVCIPTEYCF